MVYFTLGSLSPDFEQVLEPLDLEDVLLADAILDRLATLLDSEPEDFHFRSYDLQKFGSSGRNSYLELA